MNFFFLPYESNSQLLQEMTHSFYVVGDINYCIYMIFI